AVSLNEPQIGELIKELTERGIRVMALEGIEADGIGVSLPPVLKKGRPATGAVPPSSEKSVGARRSPRQEPSSLLIESPIRPGQSIIFPNADLTVLGSLASGAEVVAGGSLPIYSRPRGPPMAGSSGNARARIFCSKNEAELV